MEITSITLGAARTLNLGNFESTRLEASATIEVTPDDDLDIARAKGTEEVKTQLRALYAALQLGDKKK